MPGLMTFSATLRRTGCCCSATKTRPKPPSPICSISLYGPMTVPGSLGRRFKGCVRLTAEGDGIKKTAALRALLALRALDLIAQFRLTGAGLIEIGPPLGVRAYSMRGAQKISRCRHSVAIAHTWIHMAAPGTVRRRRSYCATTRRKSFLGDSTRRAARTAKRGHRPNGD